MFIQCRDRPREEIDRDSEQRDACVHIGEQRRHHTEQWKIQANKPKKKANTTAMGQQEEYSTQRTL